MDLKISSTQRFIFYFCIQETVAVEKISIGSRQFDAYNQYKLAASTSALTTSRSWRWPENTEASSAFSSGLSSSQPSILSGVINILTR